MRSLRCNPFLLCLLCLVFARPVAAQKDKPEPLTEVQIEKIREAGLDPNERVKLYTEFLAEHTDTIKGLTNRKDSPARSKRLDEELQSLSALMDELGSNLDTFSDRRADIRKALKPLAEAITGWSRCGRWPASRASTWRGKRPSRAAKTWPTRPNAC
jgi:hypothetical protein